MQEKFQRKQTRQVHVGDITIGGDAPIAVQSMTTEDTRDVNKVTNQIIQLHTRGAEIVRLTTPTLQDAEAPSPIKKGLRSRYRDVPLVADVHHQGVNIALEATKYVEKVRINPGLFVFHRRMDRHEEYTETEVAEQLDEIDKTMSPLIKSCKENGVAMRIGVNHGSLAERLMVMYGDTPQGMVESAMEYIRVCEAHSFKDLVVSLKASRVPVMQEANRLMTIRMDEEGMEYPLHLGVTEAGKDQAARIKGTLGIGTLLSEGIGDTIRVSLAEDPVEELSVCYDILQGLGLRTTKAEIIACPSCGRTKFDLPTMTDQITQVTDHLAGMRIAVMGCIVNGPGETADAQYGVMGLGGGKVSIRRGAEDILRVNESEAKDALVNLIKEDGKWIDPPKL